MFGNENFVTEAVRIVQAAQNQGIVQRASRPHIQNRIRVQNLRKLRNQDRVQDLIVRDPSPGRVLKKMGPRIGHIRDP